MSENLTPRRYEPVALSEESTVVAEYGGPQCQDHGSGKVC